VSQIDPAWLGPILASAGVVDERDTLTLTCERIGIDRGFTSKIVRACWRSDKAATGSGVIKIPDPEHDFLRSVREVHFYRELASVCGIHVPRCLLAEADTERNVVVLVLEDLPGCPGDVVAGCSDDELVATVCAMARMHGRWWRDERLDEMMGAGWLPRWGCGEAGTSRPHRRRAERFARRIEPCLDRFGEDAPAALATLIESIAGRYEDLLASVQALPATLMHADLHLDNIVFDDTGHVVLLDWQSVSAGPGLYDLVRFLAESMRSGQRGALETLLETYRTQLASNGGPLHEADELRQRCRELACCVLAGFVSGYGGRDPAQLRPREEAMIRQTFSADGLGGVVLALVEMSR
jgi:fructosamine-3-kinase